MARLLVGTSGYAYRHWVGPFYPKGTPSHAWLEYYARRFAAVEVNVTFYRLPDRDVFDRWCRETPDAFRFVLKGSRLITHYRRLEHAEEPLATFFERAGALGGKLDAVLWQLPPTLAPDPSKLDAFCALLPSTPRHVFEFRDERWLAPETYAVLRSRGCGLCVPVTAGRETPAEVTADFTYVRFHVGDEADGGFSAGQLDRWAAWLDSRLAEGIDAYAFFNNDAHAAAVRDASALAGRLAGMNTGVGRER